MYEENMNDIKFKSLEELYKRLIPAFNVKINDLRRNNIKNIQSEDLWNYLRKNTLIAKIFYLYFYYGLTIVEISKSLNISESSVKNYLYRTLKKLNKYMKEDEK